MQEQFNRIAKDKDVIIGRALIEEIRKSSQDIIDELSQGISVNNIDEVSASLHNEGSRSAKILLNALTKIQKSIEDQSIELGKITKESAQELQSEIKQIKLENINVKNLSEIVIPDKVTIDNFDELMYWFKKIEEAIGKIDTKPQITVNSPEVRVEVPPTVLNAPEVNLDGLMGSLEVGLRKLRQNNMSNPVFVRMTDLDRIISKLEEVKEASKNVMLGFPGAIRIQNATGGTVDFNTIGGNIFQLVPKIYDYVSLTPPSLPTIVVYKSGGAGGTTVATLTIVYSGTNISTVTRT